MSRGIFTYRVQTRTDCGSEWLLLVGAVLTLLFFTTPASTQDVNANNEFGAWFSGQFANGHAFGSTEDTHMYQFEVRYARLVYSNRSLALRYVATVVPICSVQSPGNNGQLAYAFGGGGSPIAIQMNWLRSGRIQPFLTSGGGFLYFNQPMFHATQLNFTAQVGAGIQVFTSKHRSVDFGYRYHHISNANLGNVNPGMDSHVLFVGFSFLK